MTSLGCKGEDFGNELRSLYARFNCMKTPRDALRKMQGFLDHAARRAAQGWVRGAVLHSPAEILAP